MSGPQIITLGCRLNIAESEAIREMAGGQDDLIVVNSCAVTAEAVRHAKPSAAPAANGQSRGSWSRAAPHRPSRKPSPK